MTRIASAISATRRRSGVMFPGGRIRLRGGPEPARRGGPVTLSGPSSQVGGSSSSKKSKSRMSSSCVVTRRLGRHSRRGAGAQCSAAAYSAGVRRSTANRPVPVSNAALALPTHELVLGRYRPVRPLGSGGNGSVWLARDEQHGLDVALKIIAREGKGAARAEREALAARRLRHDRCVRAYDVGHDPSHVYIADQGGAGRTGREARQAHD